MKATVNGTLIAESDDTVVVEGNHYFPRAALAEGVQATETDTTSVCPWKGTAGYLSLTVDGEQLEDAAWFYADPKPEASEIKDHLAFGGAVEVS